MSTFGDDFSETTTNTTEAQDRNSSTGHGASELNRETLEQIIEALSCTIEVKHVNYQYISKYLWSEGLYRELQIME